MLVDRRLWGRIEPELLVFPESGVAMPFPSGEIEKPLLPVPETVEFLGEGADSARASELPREREIIVAVCDRLGWRGEDFDVYRVRMPNPPIVSSVCIRHMLPPKPRA